MQRTGAGTCRQGESRVLDAKVNITAAQERDRHRNIAGDRLTGDRDRDARRRQVDTRGTRCGRQRELPVDGKRPQIEAAVEAHRPRRGEVVDVE
ncbi:MAG: hypothetical protein ACK55I_45570, partial [bacterium]